MQSVQADPALAAQVGMALWWLSGKTSYQTELLSAMAALTGRLYAQLIARADNTDSFLNDDYTSAFSRARSLGIRYLEPWDVDFSSGRWDALLADFNAYALS